MKQSALDKAIAALEQKRAAILTRANDEASALDTAISTLKAQRATKRSKGPKAVPDKGEKVSA